MRPPWSAVSRSERRLEELREGIAAAAIEPCPGDVADGERMRRVVSDRLKDDLTDAGVRVLDVFPGNIRTELFDRAESADGGRIPLPPDSMPVERVAGSCLEILDGAASTRTVTSRGRFASWRRAASSPYHRLRRAASRPLRLWTG
jgi:short-subunit dehydrogenase